MHRKDLVAVLLACVLSGFLYPAIAQTQVETDKRPDTVQTTATEADAKAKPASTAQEVQPAEGTPADDGIVNLDTMVVSGAQPGPGMWKISKGDRVMYVLGTLSPLPKRMEWISGDVEKAVAMAQEVIAPPSVSMTSDIGIFRQMLLIPSMLKARKNPDGKTLQQTVPPDLYARWQVLKPRYIGSDRGVERWRPLFAAQELYEAAMRTSGLTQDSIVLPIVRKVAKKNGIPMTPANVKLVVKDPKSVLKEFNKSALADTDCFSGTMNRIEGDLGNMRARANAWAVGDIEALRALPYNNQYATCLNAISESGVAAKIGITNLAQRVADTWISTAETALAKNQVTFATLPITEILKPNGYIERLRAKGYQVEAP